MSFTTDVTFNCYIDLSLNIKEEDEGEKKKRKKSMARKRMRIRCTPGKKYKQNKYNDFFRPNKKKSRNIKI